MLNRMICIASLFVLMNSADGQEAPEPAAAHVLGRWGKEFDWPIIPVHAVLTPNGKIFSYGTNEEGEQGAQFNYAVWTPERGTGPDAHELLPNSQGTDMFCGAITLLPNGNVLMPGGDARTPANKGIKDTLIFDKDRETLFRTGYLNLSRWYPTVIMLPNGDSLIHGGRDFNGGWVVPAEIYSKGSWRTVWGTADSTIINGNTWFYPRNFVAPDGRIFGMSNSVMYYLDWRGNGKHEVVGTLPNKTRAFTSTAVMYQPGKILQVGGSTSGDTSARASKQAIAVDINGKVPQVTPLPDMAFDRAWGNASVLPNGEVLITGGSAFDNKLVDAATTAEMWNPETQAFRKLAKAALPRLYHSFSLLLPDGSVLVGGGGAPGPLVNKNAEIYYPPYLFDEKGQFAERLTIQDFSDAQNYGNRVTIPYSGKGQVHRVSLIRSGAVTHSFDAGQRFLELPFTAHAGSLEVIMPESANIAPPGYYLLFLLDAKGVPSVSRILSLGIEEAMLSDTTPPVTLKTDAVYTLVSRFSGKCIDREGEASGQSAPIRQWHCNETDHQQFRLKATGDGYYSLQNVGSNLCIDAEDLADAEAAHVQLWECSVDRKQKLALKESVQGAFTLHFENSDACLDLAELSLKNGNSIQLQSCSKESRQDFFLRPIEGG